MTSLLSRVRQLAADSGQRSLLISQQIGKMLVVDLEVLALFVHRPIFGQRLLRLLESMIDRLLATGSIGMASGRLLLHRLQRIGRQRGGQQHHGQCGHIAR